MPDLIETNRTLYCVCSIVSMLDSVLIERWCVSWHYGSLGGNTHAHARTRTHESVISVIVLVMFNAKLQCVTSIDCLINF